jgi:PTS system fructose-specific IIC component
VETNGSGGVQNLLTAEEIAHATGIVVAADTVVNTKRFTGKRVVLTKVADGIHKPEELLQWALSDQAPIYQDPDLGETSKKEDGQDRSGFGHSLYKHLMSGVSHMLPFVIGGGILIALAFLLDDYDLNPASFGSNTPLAAFFMSVGGKAFSFMLPVLAGYIACSIGDRPALAVGFVGGALAVSGNSFSDILGEGAISGGFLAALLAGFVGGYITLGLKKLFASLPRSLAGLKPVLLFPLLGIFLIGLFMFSVNPLMTLINTGLSNYLGGMGNYSKFILGMIVAGMMSIDMGGPFNKAAYVFGTASIASGQYDIMAAVMIGGMIPPLSIALCATFFKNRFEPDETKGAYVNYFMGLSFITEGAIPYAAADPFRVLPACIAGSALSGGLSMLFGCTLRAPHGGIFVFPVVGNMYGYLAALVLGSLLGMLLLAILKKKVR